MGSYSEGRWHKPDGRMAHLAPAIESLSKDPLMIICMAISTRIVCQLQRAAGGGFRCPPVAFFACNQRMFANELEGCQVMVKPSRRCANIPTLRDVARSACLPRKRRTVGRAMTGRAIGIFFGFKENRPGSFRCFETYVALATRYCGMPARKGESRSSVVEGRRRRPRRCCVTLLAFTPYSLRVPVLVTSAASVGQPEICLASRLSDDLKNLSVADILGRMTTFALQNSMLACLDKSCLGMIEGLPVKGHRLSVSPEMLLMTGNARLLRDSEMEAMFFRNKGGYLGMTIQALLAADGVSGFVTTQAVGQAFQLLMSCRKFAR